MAAEDALQSSSGSNSPSERPRAPSPHRPPSPSVDAIVPLQDESKSGSNMAADAEPVDIIVPDQDGNVQAVNMEREYPSIIPARGVQDNNTVHDYSDFLNDFDADADYLDDHMDEDDEEDLGGLAREPVALVESDMVLGDDEAVYEFQPRVVPSINGGDGTPASVTSSSSSTGSDNNLRSFRHEDFVDAQPHPSSVFCPARMEWIIFARAEEFMLAAKPPSGEFNNVHCPIYQTEAPIDHHASLLVKPIRKATAQPNGASRIVAPFTGPLHVHRDTSTEASFVSARVPSSIPVGLLSRLKKARMDNPGPGQSAHTSFFDCVKVLFRILANASRSDERDLPVSSATIQKKLGYDDVMQELLPACGLSKTTNDKGQEVFKASAEDCDLTHRNLLEFLIWFEHNKASGEMSLAADAQDKGFSYKCERIHAQGVAQAFLGWNPSYATSEYDAINATPILKEALATVGASVKTNDFVLQRLYHANNERAPRHHFELYGAMKTIREQQRPNSHIVQHICNQQEGHGMVTPEQLKQCYTFLQVGPKEDTGSITAKFYAMTQKATDTNDQDLREKSRKALKAISYSRSNPDEMEQALLLTFKMTPEEAIKVFGLEDPTQVDEDLLISTFEVEKMENPGRAGHYMDALKALAEFRDSEKLRTYIKTGDRGQPSEGAGPPVGDGLGSLTLPAGLNNIGNTCYLNSVLQYFFALRPLRERVLQAAKQSPQLQEQQQQQPTLDASRRVGGRVVSQYEVTRSHKLILLLAQLFEAMITSPAQAVSPERELAYLALVSARVEELEDRTAASKAQESKEDKEMVDAVVVKPSEVPIDTIAAPGPPEATTSAVTLDDAVQMASPTAESKAPLAVEEKSSAATEEPATISDDVSMKDVQLEEKEQVDPRPASLQPGGSSAQEAQQSEQPPPLPPRPAIKDIKEEAATGTGTPTSRRNSLMRLGAQQDVSECLDNVLFQIEVALGQQQAASPVEGSEATAIKQEGEEASALVASTATEPEGEILKLFTGKTCQRVEPVSSNEVGGSTSQPAASTSAGPSHPTRQASTHVKNEIFTILPVDVIEETGRDIYDGLDGFFEEELLTRDDGQTVKRTVTLLEPPPVLQLLLQSVQFDRVRGVYKSQAHLQIGESLFMDRYLDFGADEADTSALLEKRRQAMELRRRKIEIRERIKALRPSNSPSVQSMLDKTSKMLKNLAKLTPIAESDPKRKIDEDYDGDELDLLGDNSPSSTTVELDYPTLSHPTLPDFLKDESTKVSQEVKALEIELTALKNQGEDLFKGDKKVEYRLMSCFQHRGEASHGHYWINQRKVEAEKVVVVPTPPEMKEEGKGEEVQQQQEAVGGPSDATSAEQIDPSSTASNLPPAPASDTSSIVTPPLPIPSVLKPGPPSSSFSAPQPPSTGSGAGVEGSTWFKYNDSVVTEIPVSEVLQDKTGGTPYLLCYVRVDSTRLSSSVAQGGGEGVFETLKREF